ncbi:hypothetical protein NDA16_001427 [Ustilago loliicola]|nr:hypothetical protein NDA16_001427 [Ustilago loliicola]
MTTTPPPMDATAPVTPPATKTTKRSPKTPKKTVKTEGSPATLTSPSTPTGVKTEGASTSPASTASPSTPSPRRNEKLTPGIKRQILSFKMRGMPTKEIATKVGQNYKTVWGFIDKTVKSQQRLDALNGTELMELSEADKKQAAMALKLAGWTTKDISTQLDMNYKTLWGFFNQQLSAAGLPAVTEDPAL